MRAHHGGARRREHVRGWGAAIVGTNVDLTSAASEKGRTKVPKPRGNSGEVPSTAAFGRTADSERSSEVHRDGADDTSHTTQ